MARADIRGTMVTTSQRVQTPWQLRADLASARFLLWVASAGRSGELRPEVHLYLYDRYWRLAIYYEQRGKTRRAQQLRIKAERHFHLFRGDDFGDAA